MSRNVTLSIGGLIVLVAIAASALYWYETAERSANAPAQPLSVAQINARAAEGDPDFAAAQKLEAEGNYEAAIPELQSAFASTDDPLQQVAILSRLQQDDELIGSYGDEVQVLEKTNSDNSYPAITRAYAVEQLGLVYVDYLQATDTALIFGQQPYRSLYVATSTNLTARNLFSYATSIYPLPVSEYYIARTYANAIFNQGLLSQTSPAAKQKLANAMQNLVAALQAGDGAMAGVSGHPPTAIYLLTAQLARATLLGQLQLLGTTSYGNAEQAFKTALAAYEAQNRAIDGAVRLQYAYFLASAYGSARAGDIQTLLAPIYQDPQHGGSFVEPILKSYIGVPISRGKSTIALTASVDPQFKVFLSSLGWTSADFSTSTAATK